MSATTSRKIETWMVGSGLLIVGLIVFRWFRDWPTIHAVGEAAFIAGLLTIFVDPILKKSLAKEASRGIFQHLLGFDQEPEIRDRLRDIAFGTRLCRRDYVIRCSLQPEANGFVTLNVEAQFDVVNYSNEAIRYAPTLQFEKCEHPEVSEISVIGDECYNVPFPALLATEPGVLEAKTKEVPVEPNKRGKKYKVFEKYSVKMPSDFFYVFNFGAPTINASIDLEGPTNLEIRASPGTSQVDHHFQYRQLFMPGEHITIKWWCR